MTSAERRLFGASRPHKNTNARHRALLRKALEVVPDRELEAKFGQPTHLRVVMGTALGFFQMGKITSNFLRDGRVVYRDTEIPDLAVCGALHAYLAAYDVYFMKRGDDYIVRNPQARAQMQAAKQRWHNFIVPYLTARGSGQRPDWALEPLPGLDRVHVPRVQQAAAPLPPIPARSPARPLHRIALPTPPPTSPIRVNSTPSRSSSSRLNPIDLSDGVHQVSRCREKRKRLDVIQHLGVIDISDDDDQDAQRPRKIAKFLGFVDLTS
ncbi:hypothetical protein DFH07DRAFT_963643 [Mycena maculata]|uniref:Uncharacterized protein n=1 Tax=Mycena maculata TaxID=230809 RepID=A0AAD7IKA4_9AGAR|nr:hypothetical protein DFH07DRAFT_963643 [Mycena maculata]